MAHKLKSPAKASSSDPRLELLIIVYGSAAGDPLDDSRFSGQDQRRAEVRLTPVVPAGIVGNTRQISAWAQSLVQGLGVDVKHSHQWHCEFCDKLARESKAWFASWCHLSPPRVVVYMHLMCDSRKETVCGRKLAESQAELHRMTGMGPASIGFPQLEGPMPFPAAASCAGCKKEETVASNLSRCSRCKLTRYCGTECQRNDWNRHKTNCKMVREVKWVWD